METTSLTFGAPDWFWLLAAIPLAAILFLWSHRRGRELVSKIVAPRLREQLAGSVSPPVPTRAATRMPASKSVRFRFRRTPLAKVTRVTSRSATCSRRTTRPGGPKSV